MQGLLKIRTDLQKKNKFYHISLIFIVFASLVDCGNSTLILAKHSSEDSMTFWLVSQKTVDRMA